MTRGRKEVEQEYTERIRRLREKYEGELEDLSREIEVHKSKFCKARDDFVSKEEEFIVLSAVVKQKEVTLSELEKVFLVTPGVNIKILFSSTLFHSGEILSNRSRLKVRQKIYFGQSNYQTNFHVHFINFKLIKLF